MPRVDVVAGILKKAGGLVLIADRTRSHSLKDCWEFPGGKVDVGESSSSALSRELTEELGIEVLAAEHFRHIEHDYPDLKVAIDFYLVTDWQGDPRGAEGQQIKWVEAGTLHQQSLLPADAPIVEALSGT